MKDRIGSCNNRWKHRYSRIQRFIACNHHRALYGNMSDFKYHGSNVKKLNKQINLILHMEMNEMYEQSVALLQLLLCLILEVFKSGNENSSYDPSEKFILHFSFLSNLATRQINIKVARKWENITEILGAVSSFKVGWGNNSERKYYSISWLSEEAWRTVRSKVNGNTMRNCDCFTQTGRMALSLVPLEAGCSMGGCARAEGLEKQHASGSLTPSHLSFITPELHRFVAELVWQAMALGCESLS